MKLSKIRLAGVINLPVQGSLVSLTDEFILRDVQGLGPTPRNLSIPNIRYQKRKHSGQQATAREIVMRIGLNPDYSLGRGPETMRGFIYSAIAGSASIDYILVELFEGSDVAMQTKTYFKNLEIVPFAKDPQVQLTLSSTSAYFQSPAPTIQVGGNINPMWFVPALGNAPIGIKFSLTLHDAFPSGFEITRPFTDERMFLDYAFLSGDLITIDTREGSRSVTVKRGVTTTNLLYALSADSTWFLIRGGEALILPPDPGLLKYNPAGYELLDEWQGI